MRPLKNKLRRQEQETDPLAAKINIGTHKEEAEEELTDNLLRRQKRSDAEQNESGPVKDSTPTPRSEGPKPRKETKLVQPEPVIEYLFGMKQQHWLSKNRIELPISPG